MRKVSDRSDIFPVFHDLFQRRETARRRPRHDRATDERLFEGADWDFDTLQRIHDALRGDRASANSGSTSIRTRSR